MSYFRDVDKVLEVSLKALNYPSEAALNKDVGKLKEWIKTQPHLPEIMDDQKIKNFLILNKGSIEKTKEKIDNYYSVRSRLPEIFDYCNPKLPIIQKYLNAMYMVPLPKAAKNYNRVIVLKVRDKNLTEECDINTNNLRHCFNLLEIRINEDIFQADEFILDGRDISFSVMTSVTPSLLYKASVHIFNGVFSNRVRGIYLLYPPPLTETILAVLKKIVKPKILERVHVCSDENVLIEHFGKEILPRDFGGEEDSLEELHQTLRKKLDQYQDRFDELDKLRVNEQLRPAKLKNDEMLGFHGSFKSLQID